ncbi:MAG: ABC transporter ATP-binding protein/permease [Muribaculum sp.]|nr:ABC transporter ATP-binding protein/permease [Muribaculum sp.]
MNNLRIFLSRFTRPYLGTISVSVVFNLLSAFLTIFSFAFIIPILQLLFGINKGHYSFMEWSDGNLTEVLTNNFYYYTDQIIASHGATVALAFLSLVFVAMTLLRVICFYFSQFFTIPMKLGVIRDIRDSIYSKILSLPIGFFSHERKGDIMSRISSDVIEVEVSVTASLYSLIKFPITIIVCLVVMIVVSWKLTLFVLILLPVAGGIMSWIGRKLKAKSLKAQQILGRIMSTTEESIGGLRIIKAFNAERTMDRLFQSQTDDFFRVSRAVDRRIALAHPMSEFLGTIAITAVLWFGGSLILGGNSDIDAADFIFYLVTFYNIINPAKELAKTGYTLRKGMAALGRIDAILQADNPIKDPTHPKPLPASAASGKCPISYRDVSFRYEGGERNVLSDINLDVKGGSVVAIVGQSGSGKSTLVDLLPRFYDIDHGEILIDGVNIKDFRVADLRSLMGNVNQEAILFNDSFFNNIAFGVPNATPEQVEAAARIANAHDFIMDTPEGYSTLVGDRGCRLSGGQRQRVSIARAILKNPPILILDEATSALDTESERLVQEALERLMKNRTTLVIAHRLSTIVNADLICVMHEGRIVERGTHSQLLELNGHYRHLVEMQSL